MTSIWTRQELLEEIALYKKALRACATGSSYTIGSRSLTRQDLDKIRAHLDWLAGELDALENGRGPKLVHGRINYGTDRWRRP